MVFLSLLTFYTFVLYESLFLSYCCTLFYNLSNKYINKFSDVVCLNITHNMADLSELGGKYYLIENYNIKEYKNKELVIEKYIN